MAKSSFGTSVYGPDTSFIEGVGNIASMFDPKAEAQAALSKAHRDYYSNQGRLAAANAAGVEDQNSALSENALLAAGYTPIQIAAIRATRTKSMTDLFKGVNLNKGATILTEEFGDPRTALALMGQGAAATNPDFAWGDEAANDVATRNTDNKIRIASESPSGSTSGTKVLPAGGTLVNSVTGETLATGTAKPISPATAVRNQSALADLVAGQLGGVRDRKTGQIMIQQDGKLVPLDRKQANDLVNKVQELGGDPNNISDILSQAAQNGGYDIGTLEDTYGSRTLFHPITGPKVGVKFKQEPMALQTTRITETIPTAAATPAAPIKITADAAGKAKWESLAPGTQFISPDGQIRIK